jgi:chromosome segregation ATPase
VDLDEAIVSKRKELLSLEEEFLRTIENNRLIRLKEDVEWEQRNQVLRSEVEGLENRKLLALLPLEEREQKIQDTEEALLQRENNVSKREEEASKNLELLELRLDDASDRLQNVQKRTQELNKREEGIKAQEAVTRSRTDEFNSVLTKTLLGFDLQRNDIATKLLELEGKQVILTEKEARISAKEKDLVSRETLLQDRYQTLGRAIEEHKRKNNIPKSYK